MSINDRRSLTEDRRLELESRVERINHRILNGDKILTLEQDLVDIYDHMLAQEVRNQNKTNIVVAMNAIAGALDEIPAGSLVQIDDVKLLFAATLQKYIAPDASSTVIEQDGS